MDGRSAGMDLDVSKTGISDKRDKVVFTIQTHAVGFVADHAPFFAQYHLSGADQSAIHFPLPANNDVVTDFVPGLGGDLSSNALTIGDIDQEPTP
jgi:hypothetical protein